MPATITGSILNSKGAFVSPTTVQFCLVVPVAIQPGNTSLATPAIDSAVTDGLGFLSLALPTTNGGATYKIRIIQGAILTPTYDTGWFYFTVFDNQLYTWAQIQPSNVPNVRPDLDLSISRIATQITSDPGLSSQFRQAVGLVPRGAYSASGFYRSGDLVNWQGSSFTPLLPSFITNITPPATAVSDANWQLVASVGSTGVGAGTGNDGVYNQAAWLADAVQPPTRKAVAGKFQSVDAFLAQTANLLVSNTWTGVNDFANITTSNVVDVSTATVTIPSAASIRAFAAPLSNPTFTGSVVVPVVSQSDSTGKAAATQWVKQEFVNQLGSARKAGLVNRALLQYNNCQFTQNTTAADVLSTMTAVGGGSLVPNINQVNTIAVNPQNNGVFSIVRADATTGFYLVTAVFSLGHVGGGTPSQRIVATLQYSTNGGSSWLTLGSNTLPSGVLAPVYNAATTVTSIISVPTAQTYLIRIALTTYSASTTGLTYQGNVNVLIDQHS